MWVWTDRTVRFHHPVGSNRVSREKETYLRRHWAGSCVHTLLRAAESSSWTGWQRRCRGAQPLVPDFPALLGCWFGNRTKKRGWQWLSGQCITLTMTLDTTSDDRSWRWKIWSTTRSTQAERRAKKWPALKKLTVMVSLTVSPSDRGIAMMKSKAAWDHWSLGTGRE